MERSHLSGKPVLNFKEININYVGDIVDFEVIIIITCSSFEKQNKNKNTIKQVSCQKMSRNVLNTDRHWIMLI